MIDPILSTGDTIGDYQMSGIPDGLGAYKTGGDTLQVLMNHELDPAFFPFVPAGVGARVSHLELNRKTHGVLSGSYPITGLEGFLRFCSSSLARLNGVPWYFTGEEGTDDHRASDNLGRGGSSIALNVKTGDWVETAHFGRLLHENIVPVKRLSKAFFLTTDDDFRGDAAHKAYLYAYIADSWSGAISGSEGSLYVWTADAATSDAGLTKGQTLDGHFVPVTQVENATSDTLDAASSDKNGFKFTRLEDASVSQERAGRVYFDDTGRLGANTVKGRLYRMDIDPSNPTHASVTLLLDGDASDDLINPDNLATSAHSVVIQEDRNSEHRGPIVPGRPDDPGYGRILVYDVKTGTIRRVARVDTPAALRPGTWESSGVINAQTLLGRGWWLVDVQAHDVTAPQPGMTLAPDSSTGEDGQLLAIYIPNS